MRPPVRLLAHRPQGYVGQHHTSFHLIDDTCAEVRRSSAARPIFDRPGE
jgi:hypothetical protein